MFFEPRSSRSPLLLLAAMMACATGSLPAESGFPSTHRVAAGKASIVDNYGKLPLRFEANRGQADRSVRFLSHGRGYGISLTAQEAVLSLRGSGADDQRHAVKTDLVHLQLKGSNPQAAPEALEQLPGVSNYIIGNDPRKWYMGVPNYQKVRYQAVYPGIDLVYYGNQNQLEYDFVVAAGANPEAIRLHFSGARAIELDAGGNLEIVAEDGSIAFQKPVLYQTRNGIRKLVSGRFALKGNNTVGFTVGDYDRARTLVIDPTLVYSTYLGGSNLDSIAGIALDASGNTYLTGYTVSTDYPVTPGVYQVTDKDERSSVFVTKMNSSGTALVYSTYLGGSGGPSGGDVGEAIAVDSDGDAYVTGTTYSTNFPATTGAYQTTNKAAANSSNTSFVTKLNPTGTGLIYSTYLGGTFSDNASSVALDSAGDAYIAGVAYSSNFPTTAGVLQTTNLSAPHDDGTAFVAKLNPSGSGLVYSTYLGGSTDYISPATVRVVVDASGDAYVAGGVGSTDFPVTAGAYQATNKGVTGGGSNLTLSKLNPTATKLLYSTYLGGSGAGYLGDTVGGLAIDSAGNAYLTGSTYESNFPTTSGAFRTTNNDSPSSPALPSGYVTKMNPTGTGLVYSTFLGGSGGTDGDHAFGLAVDSSGDAFITGSTGSTDFPVTSNAYQTANAAAFNNGAVVFLTELNPAGSSLLYSTYFGGSNSFSDTGYGVVLGPSGAVYFAGTTGAKDFPITPGAYEATFNSINFTTGFVAELNLGSGPLLIATGTYLTSTENPSVAGANLTFAASVVPASGTTVPTGNVIFNIDQANVATVALNAKGYAYYSTASLANGQHAILASYQGSAAYSASGGGITENIEPIAPVIAPLSGVYPAAQLVAITDATPNTTIYYTIDGSTPTASSTKYTAPILVSTSQTIQAIAALAGVPVSQVTRASFALVTAPTALAAPANTIGTTNATVTALLSTYGMAGSYYFVYGTSASALTSSTATTALGTSGLERISIAPVAVNAVLNGLTTKTTYYYQVVVTTAAGTSSGAVLSFTTN